jgi:hypothetical protein
VQVVTFHDVRFLGEVAVITKISFFWWWVHVSEHVNLYAFFWLITSICSLNADVSELVIWPTKQNGGKT